MSAADCNAEPAAHKEPVMTPASSRCPHCDAALPASAPAGVCPRCLVARSLAPHEAAPDAPADFGDFVFGEMLGRGGMGAVFRARQKSLDRDVALKLLPLDLLDDEEFLDRFEREARLMARHASGDRAGFRGGDQ